MNDEEDNYPQHKIDLDKRLADKGKELFKIVYTLQEDLPDSDMLKQQKAFMMEDVLILRTKIAGASGNTLYSIKMENATLIRKAAMSLYISKHSFALEEYTGMHYFDMLRDVIDEFREIFIDWVDSFDKWEYIKDDWNLFNPPGVHARDKDPDEDIPFTNPLNPDGDEG